MAEVGSLAAQDGLEDVAGQRDGGKIAAAAAVLDGRAGRYQATGSSSSP
jgi:hypothetical protein